MRIWIIFLLFSINTILHAQTPSLEAAIQHVNNGQYGYVSDSSLCEKYYKRAVRDIDRKNLEYLIYNNFDYTEDTVALRFQKTEWMWMRKNTPFVQAREWYDEDSLAFSDDIPSESSCYDAVFFEYKAQKFGNDFSAKVTRIADSLEGIGYGYYPAEFSRKNIENYFNRESRFKLDYTIFEDVSSFSSLKNTIILANVRINESGEITSITCWDTRSSGPITYSLSAENKYVQEIERLLGKAGRIHPAVFEKKAISDGFSFYFPFTE